jgi:hypothetical protein
MRSSSASEIFSRCVVMLPASSASPFVLALREGALRSLVPVCAHNNPGHYLHHFNTRCNTISEAPPFSTCSKHNYILKDQEIISSISLGKRGIAKSQTPFLQHASLSSQFVHMIAVALTLLVFSDNRAATGLSKMDWTVGVVSAALRP